MKIENHDIFNKYLQILLKCRGVNQKSKYHIYDLFWHTIYVFYNTNSNDNILLMSALLHDIGKLTSYQYDKINDVKHFYGHSEESVRLSIPILEHLCFSKKDTHDILELIRYHEIPENISIKGIKRWCKHLSLKQIDRLFILRESDIKSQNPKYENIRLINLHKQKEVFITIKNSMKEDDSSLIY